MVQLLRSHFLDNPRKHLNSFAYRKKETFAQYWTSIILPRKRLTDIDLYVLTSRKIFSAPEESIYDLKILKRAAVIGETNGVGGHNNEFMVLTERFMMSLPFARAKNPFTHQLVRSRCRTRHPRNDDISPRWWPAHQRPVDGTASPGGRLSQR
jgi:hypothetical protein